jgi:signal transduction histidine kinase
VIASAARAPNRLRVRAGRHYFEFKFTALSFTSPDKVRFKWQLDGLERDWVEGGTKRSVSYSFIPPGDYVFRVQACNNDGVWNQEGAALQLVVLPSYWQTSWFRLLAVGTLAALLFGLYRLKVARMRALERLRLRIARDLHDEVGANLGSISLLAQVMEKKPSTEDATLVRDIAGQTVDTLRDIVWFIDPAHERLSDLVARMRETAGALLHEIPFQFESGGDFSSEHLPLDFRRNALPWFKEALHNIVKHARATQVKITVRRRGNAFEVQIHDNGIGFDPRARSSGNGLKNLKRRAREMRGELSIDSQPGQGATLSLRARIT